jgi:hypothetical protein
MPKIMSEERAAVAKRIAELDAKLDAPKSSRDPVTISKRVALFYERAALIRLLDDADDDD